MLLHNTYPYIIGALICALVFIYIAIFSTNILSQWSSFSWNKNDQFIFLFW